MLTLLDIDSLSSWTAPSVIHFPSKETTGGSKLVIGRGSPSNAVDIVLSASRNDREVISRRHAEIVTTTANTHIVKDLQSLNGTFVNNRRIDSRILKDGDIVQFGGVAKVPIGKLIQTSDISLKYKYSRLDGPSSSLLTSSSPMSTSKFVTPKDTCPRKINTPLNFKRPRQEQLDSVVPAKASSPQNDSVEFISRKDSSTSTSNAALDFSKEPNALSTPKTPEDSTNNISRIYKILPMTLKSLTNPEKSEEETTVPNTTSLISSISSDHSIDSNKLLDAKKIDSNGNGNGNDNGNGNGDGNGNGNGNGNGSGNEGIVDDANGRGAQPSSLIVDSEDSVSNETPQYVTEMMKMITSIDNRVKAIQQDQEKMVISFEKSQRSEILDKKSKDESSIVDSKNKTPGMLPELCSMMTCSICSHLLIDPVILLCSHGYCKYCIENHWNSKSSRCPTCNDSYHDDKRSDSSNPTKDWSHPYVKSTHLETILSLVLDHSSSDFVENYSHREKEYHEKLQRLGIKEDVNPYSKNSYKLLHDDIVEEVKDVDRIRTKGGGNNRGTKRKYIDVTICSYCGEEGHDDSACPYQSHDSSSEGSIDI